MVAILGVVAVFTVVELAAQRFGTAGFAGLHRPEMAVRQLVPDLGSGLRAREAEARSPLYHDRASMRRLMEAAALSCALTVRGVETEVVEGEEGPRDSWMRRRCTPASRRGVAQEWRSVGTDARLGMLLALSAARKASCPLDLGLGWVAVAIPGPARPGAGQIQTGWRGVSQ
jgi:hypothetical protein